MQNNECRTIVEHYTEYRDKSLRNELKSQVETHLSTCSSCRSQYDALDQLLGQLKTLPTVKTSENFTQSLMDRIEAEGQASRWQIILQSGYTKAAGYAIAAGLVVAIGLSFWLDPVQPGNPQPQLRYADEDTNTEQNRNLAAEQDSLSPALLDSGRTTIQSGTEGMQLVSGSK